MLLVEYACYPRYSAADMAKLRERSVMADSYIVGVDVND